MTQARGQIIDQKVLKRLCRRSDRAGVLQTMKHALLIASTTGIVSVAQGLWLWPAMALHGIVLVFLFTALHEAIHRTVFRTRPLNDVLAWICGLVLVLPPAYFRYFHFAHHRHTQIEGHDPELEGGGVTTWRGYLLHLTGIPFWRGNIAALLRHLRGIVEEPYVPAHAHPLLILQARLLLCVYGLVAIAAVAAGTSAPLVYWLCPVVLGQPALRAYVLAEHTLCPRVPDMLRNTRTTLTTPMIRLLAWNMPYHAEHHAFPAVPFHALPELHALMAQRIETVTPGYRRFHERLWRSLSVAPSG